MPSPCHSAATGECTFPLPSWIAAGAPEPGCQGRRIFRKAIQLAPNYALSHYELGKLLVQSNRLPAAAEEFSRRSSTNPT